MKNLLILFLASTSFALTSCAQRLDSKTVLKQIKYIKVTEEPIARTAIINAHFDAGRKGPYHQNIPLTSLPASRENSEIVITDTVGVITDDNNVVIIPSAAGINVIIDANIQNGDYYCQSTTISKKMTCERGELGVHLLKRDLTTIDTYTAADHFASAAARNLIVIYSTANGAAVAVQQYSTTGTEICVYRDNPDLVVASRP